jgi:hypothetical protein
LNKKIAKTYYIKAKIMAEATAEDPTNELTKAYLTKAIKFDTSLSEDLLEAIVNSERPITFICDRK